MNSRRNGKLAGRGSWPSKVALSFTAGFVGGVCIPGVHWLVYGGLDPFAHGWPLLLESLAFGLAMVAALRLAYPSASVLGLYAGLVAVMLASGESEYPIASLIALAVHGLVPAALGYAVVAGIRYVMRKPPDAVHCSHP